MPISHFALWRNGALRLTIKNIPITTRPIVNHARTKLNQRPGAKRDAHVKLPRKKAATRQTKPAMIFNAPMDIKDAASKGARESLFGFFYKDAAPVALSHTGRSEHGGEFQI